MRCSRTHLNGGEREQEHVIGALEEGLQARANLNGGELDEGPVLPDGEPGARCVMSMHTREQRREDKQRSIGGDWRASQDQPKWWRSGSVNLCSPYLCLCPCLYGLLCPCLCPCLCSCLSFHLWGQSPYLFAVQRWKKGGILGRVESSPLEPLAGPLPVPIVTCGEGLPFTGSSSKPP